MSGLHENLRFVVYADDGAWTAQGLEHDICAHAPDLNTLYERLTATLQAEIAIAEKKGTTVAAIAPAPDHFFQMWQERSGFTLTIGGNSHGHAELALCA